MSKIRGYAAETQNSKLNLIDFDLGALGDEQVEIEVESCGICHSDLSMIANEWGNAVYPLVPGHEVVGKVVELGSKTKGLQIGDRVGLGWFSASCGSCAQCRQSYLNLCPSSEQTIVARHGGFAERVRSHWQWAIKVPEKIDPQGAGPLFCGGITVFSPIVECGVKPSDRVAVIGIGGLGHMAIKFLQKWGCEVTAFTSPGKIDEARAMGATRCVNSRDPEEIAKHSGEFDFILSTVNVSLPWDLIINALAPRGRLHLVGAVLEPVPVQVFQLLAGQKTISASPLGRPAIIEKMLEFCVRHDIAPQIESFPMSKVNDALEHLHSGKARYRIVLENDF